MDAAVGLLRVVDMLSSERMEIQGRLLGIGSLLHKLRGAATSFHAKIESGSIERLEEIFPLPRLRTEIAQLRDVLEVVLRRQARAGAWYHYQVPALSISDLIFRRATVRKLRLSLEYFVELEPAAPRLGRMDTFDLLRKARPQASTSRTILMDADGVQGPAVGRAELVEKMVNILLAGVEDGLLVVVPIVGGPGIGKSVGGASRWLEPGQSSGAQADLPHSSNNGRAARHRQGQKNHR